LSSNDSGYEEDSEAVNPYSYLEVVDSNEEFKAAESNHG
jgi:hypothetical protein